MAKMWTGRTSGITSQLADDFNSSISFDSRMYRQDITGSIAHAAMLGRCGIISQEESEQLQEGLRQVLADLENGTLQIDLSCEDIHMFVEQVLTQRLGDVGKKLHTARSRNDQVALDLRLYLRDETDDILFLIRDLILALMDQAKAHKTTIMPGYTHLQRAQPVTFGHHLLAYCMMLLRDMDRLQDGRRRMNISPIGSCALAGTTYPTDRYFEAQLLEMPEICLNSMDGVSDRDFCLEMAGDLSILMTHLSRLAEEVLLWTSWEFRFIELSDAFTTGSSIMPQKKNSDMAELVRGKTGRVFGDLLSLLTMMKGIPLAYNKDMQEDKERIFDAVDTVKMCLPVFTGMLSTMTVHPENMLRAAQNGFINATDAADYLTKKGVPFRSAYKITGELVSRCMQENCVLETLPLSIYKEYSDQFEEDIYAAVDLKYCVEARTSTGGASLSSVEEQIAYVEEKMSRL